MTTSNPKVALVLVLGSSYYSNTWILLAMIVMIVIKFNGTCRLINYCMFSNHRSKRSKSVRVEDFQSSTQSVDFSPIGEGGGLVGSFEDSEVVLTNAHT